MQKVSLNAAETTVENQALREKADQTDREKEQLKKTRAELENQLIQTTRQLQTASQDVANRTQKIHALNESADQLAQEKKQLQQIYLDLTKQLAESRNSFQEISENAAAKDRKLADMEKNRQELLSQINMYEKEKEELQRLKNALNNQLGMTQSQIEAVSTDVAAKEEQLKTKEQQIESMETAFQALSMQLKQQIKEKEVQIDALENKLNIRVLNKILFASGRADITAEGDQVLESLADELKKMDGFEIAVAGHTDNMLLGPKIKEAYYDNLGLSVARAAAVSRTLRDKGVSPANLSAIGYSMYRPIADNGTKEGRQQNRRVEIILAPLR